MVVGRLLILSLCISLAACGTTKRTYVSDSVGSSANTSYSPNTSYINMVANFAKWKAYKLPEGDQMLQEQAVFFALDNLQEGDVTEWIGESNSTHGKVSVVMTYPMGGGFCRVLLSQINYKQKVRSFKETACKNGSSKWRFVR